MKKPFEKAADTLTVVNVKTHKDLMDQIRPIFDARYPELAQNDEMYEDFTNQLGRKGFFNALVDSSNGKVKGFAAGVVYDSNTAAFTYLFTPEGDKAGSQKLKDETLKGLDKRDVQAVYAELFTKGHETNPERDGNERAMFKQLGMVKVPITYSQPSTADSDEAISGLDLNVLFTKPSLRADRKSVITVNHLHAFTRAYDENLENPKNVKSLEKYERQLANADWGIKAPSNALKKDF